jgi:nucleoside-diphosphate-sugar epimerase
MTVLVTGANGFVGSKLCEYFLNKGIKVRGLVRPSSDMQFLESLPGLEIHQGNITDSESLEAPMKGVNTLYHVAGYSKDWGDWSVFKSINIDGVNTIMQSAKKHAVKTVVHVSSVSIYGFPGSDNIDENFPINHLPEDFYCTSKLEGEIVALSYNDKKMKVTAVRPAGVYGPNDRTTTLQLVPELAKGKIPLLDNGKYLMAPLYIDNLIDAMILAAQSKNSGGQVYNIADSGKITWKQYFELICNELKVPAPRLSLPSGLVWNVAKIVEAGARFIGKKEAPTITKYRIRVIMNDAHYNIEKSKIELGFEPKVSTAEGMKRTMDWYKRYIASVNIINR